MNKNLLTMALLSCSAMMSAQSLTPELVERFAKENKIEGTERVIRDALAAGPVSNIALNQDNQTEKDTYFSHSVPSKGITDQQSSGRCWLFTGLNVMRSKMIREQELATGMEFSQNYLCFYDQLEKANLFLQAIIDTRKQPMDDRTVNWLFTNPLSDGGTFTGVADLVAKYGIVPKGVMPETYASNNTSQFTTFLKRKLREDALILRANAKMSEKQLQELKEKQLSEIYKMLRLGLGQPVKEFTWAPKDNKGKNIGTPKTYTPQSFYQKFIGEPLNDNYVMLMNDPTREYYKVYEIDYDRHVYDGHNWLYVNLPVDRIKDIAISSIRDGKAMYFSCDVAKFLNSKKGVLDIANYDYASLFGIDLNMDKRQRVMTHASGSSHAMTLMAVDIRDDKPLKWMVENSWGAESGYKGHLIMTDEWFNEYMFRLVAEKKYVPSDILEILKQEPVRLPAWDPMFAPEE